MSEVKPVHRYKAQTLFSFGGAKIEYFPRGPEVVMASEYDAQRLRADTAEATVAERDEALALKQRDLIEAQTAVNGWARKHASAEQRTADISVILSRIIEVQKTDYSIRGGLPHRWECLIAEAEAALNPNPEAENHE